MDDPGRKLVVLVFETDDVSTETRAAGGASTFVGEFDIQQVRAVCVEVPMGGSVSALEHWLDGGWGRDVGDVLRRAADAFNA